MGFFKPNIEKMRAKGDIKGLIKAFKKYGDNNIVPYNDYTNPDSGLRDIIRIAKERVYPEIIWKIYHEIYPCNPKVGVVNLDEYAILTLGEMGDKRAVESLIEIVQKYAWADAISALGKIKDKRAVEPLIKVLEEIPERGYTFSLMDIPSDPRTIVKALYVVHALVEIGDERAIGPLKNVLKDSRRYSKSYVESFRRRNVKFPEDAVLEIESVIKKTVKEAIKKIQKGKKD